MAAWKQLQNRFSSNRGIKTIDCLIYIRQSLVYALRVFSFNPQISEMSSIPIIIFT